MALFLHGDIYHSQGFFCQILTAVSPVSVSLPINKCVLPQGLNGLVAVFITPNDQPLSGNVIERQNSTVIAGPALTFVDSEVDQTSLLIRKKGSSGSVSS
jgi:hypothetical protein